MTENIFDILSTREVALIFYLLVGICIGLMIKAVRNSLFDLLRILFGKHIGPVLLLQAAYTTMSVYFLSKIDLWNHLYLKDTLFWFFTSAIITFFQINKAKDSKFFVELCKENLKWAAIIDFLVNFYTFSIWTELVLLPCLFLLGAMSAVADRDEKHAQVSKLIKGLLGFIGLVLILYCTFKTIQHLREFLTLHTLVEFLLPPILSILLIPFFYILAVYMQYEVLFVRINMMLVMTEEKRRTIKKEILLNANFSLNKISLVSQRISKFDLHQSTDIKATIRTLLSTNS